jgi:tetratricopeptide (TPR) repeat protein
MIALKQYYGTEPEWIADIAELYAVQTIFTRSDSADAWFMKALNSQPWRPETFASCIAMYDKLKLYGVAIEMFDTFPQYEAHQPHFRVMRAIDEVRAGKIDDGVRRFLNGFPLISGATVFADTIIQELREKDAADKLGAIYDVLSAPALHDNVDALMLLADGAFLGGDPQTSLDYCNRAEAIESANGFLLARKARALYGVGKTDESFKLFESILAEHPRTTNAYLYYSQLLANDPSQFDKAANWARAACVETDASLNEVLNLCDVYYKVGRYDLMLGEARKMLNLHPSEPDVPYWVGLGLYLNQRDSAQMFFDKSIALGLKGEKLQRAKETLAKVRNR